MFQHQGIWLPDGEKHFPEWMTKNGEIVDGRGTYQIKKLREAMKHVRTFRRAVDVGAHVGLWSMHLVSKFAALDAFEPVAAFRACFIENLKDQLKGYGDPGHVCALHLRGLALGARNGWASMKIDWADTGGTHVDPGCLYALEEVDEAHAAAIGLTRMCKLDSFAFDDVDFIKIDCEGFELDVLRGAVETINRSRPTVIVEQKPHKLAANFGIKGAPAVEFLKTLGYHVKSVMSGDYVMTPTP